MLHHEFINSAKKNKNKLAIKDVHLDKSVNYKRCLTASLILSEKIKKKYSQDFIGIMIPTSLGCALTVIATLMAGKVPVMINYSTGAADNAEYAQRKCGFETIITSKALLKKIRCRWVSGMVFIEDIMESITKTDKLLAALKANLPAAILNKQVYHSSEDDLAVILFTSGSEKDPKAVGLSHKNIISNIQAAVEHVGLLPEDVFIGILPYFHVFGFNTNLFVPLLTGSSLVTYPNPLDYKKVTNIIKNENITILIGTPSFLSGYIKQADVGDFKSLRLAISGADKTPEWLFKEYKQKHDVILLEGYGSTETSPIISINQPDNYKIGSIGKPLKNINVKIESVDSSELLSEEKVGKILVKGDSIFTGYFDDLEETSFRIRDGWYDTGDMGSLDKDGFLWHKGRLRRFVKIGGEMISLVNVESILEKYLPDNVECCVIEIPDTRKGSKIIAVTSENIDKIEILKKLKNNLPNIALPKNFVTLENLPKMGSGKIDFRTITEMVKNLSYHQQ